MNTEILTSFIISLSVMLTSVEASVKKRIYIPVLTPAQEAEAAASARASTVAGQLQPLLPTKNYGKVIGEIKKYWDGTHLIHEVIKDLGKQEKAELCNDLALVLNSGGLFTQVPSLLRSAGFGIGAGVSGLTGISAECKSVLFNNFIYSMMKTGNYKGVLESAKSVGYWTGSGINSGIFTNVKPNFKAELCSNVACCLAKLSEYDQLRQFMLQTAFWNRTCAQALSLVPVSPVQKAALGAALSCCYIEKADYAQLMNLVMRPWGYWNGSALVAKAITDISEPYKSIVKNILEIGFTETGRSDSVSFLKKL